MGLTLNGINLLRASVYLTINDPEYSEEKARFIEVLEVTMAQGRANGKRPAWFTGTGQINLVIEVSEEEAYPVLISESYDGNNASSSSSSIPTNKPVSRFPPFRLGRTITPGHDLIDSSGQPSLRCPRQRKPKQGDFHEGGAFWFKDGLEEFIHGGDYLIQYSGASNLTDLVNAMGAGMIKAEESWEEPRIISPSVTCMKN